MLGLLIESSHHPTKLKREIKTARSAFKAVVFNLEYAKTSLINQNEIQEPLEP
jgi:hypothetical protein